MDINNLNSTKILIETLNNEFGINYNTIYEALNCSQQTLSNWRNGTSTPNKTSIDLICKTIPKLLKSEDQIQQYSSVLKTTFSDLGTTIRNSINACDSLDVLLKYLCENMSKDIKQDKFSRLFNTPTGNNLLAEIFNQKILINKEKYPIFQVEKLDIDSQKFAFPQNLICKFSADKCFILRFKGNGKKYAYKVLVDFNFNQQEYENMADFTDSKDTFKFYDVDMILLFGNVRISDREIALWINQNIYTERIDTREILLKNKSKDYIYSSSDNDFELESLANQYSDIVIGRLRKYFSVVFKNILFYDEKPLTAKQKDSNIFWDAKYATRHHISFQKGRISSFLPNSATTALAIGYLSFPCMLSFADKFDSVYLLDNSNTAIKTYEKYVSNNLPEISKKIKFVTFTSALSYIATEQCKLYNSLDFILIGTGSGSFIKKIQDYYLLFNLWLKPQGILYASFLNKAFLYEYVDKITAAENFEFIPNIELNSATALISNNPEKYDLYCETYDYNELKNITEKYFSFIKMYSYPLASVLEGTHKSKLQNILKELDKEYSRAGFTSQTFSNCKGYYIDGLFRKQIGLSIFQELPDNLRSQITELSALSNYEDTYLKTLLLVEKSSLKINYVTPNIFAEIYVFVLPSYATLPETTQQEICIGTKKLRLLEVSEINALGLEYKNINPFLKSRNNIKLNCNYDAALALKPNKYVYIGAGNVHQVCRIQTHKLLKLLDSYHYSEVQLNRIS